MNDDIHAHELFYSLQQPFMPGKVDLWN